MHADVHTCSSHVFNATQAISVRTTHAKATTLLDVDRKVVKAVVVDKAVKVIANAAVRIVRDAPSDHLPDS